MLSVLNNKYINKEVVIEIQVAPSEPSIIIMLECVMSPGNADVYHSRP